MTDKLTVGSRIVIAMQNMGYSEETLSIALKCVPKILQRWTHDHDIPNINEIHELAKWLRVDAIWLLTGARPEQNGYGDIKSFNNLSPAEAERLDLLSEEMAETIQVIGKIKRHGYESRYPKDGFSNRELLEKELGDVMLSLGLMTAQKDIRKVAIEFAEQDKAVRIKPFLHHQEWFTEFNTEHPCLPYFLSTPHTLPTDNDWIMNLS